MSLLAVTGQDTQTSKALLKKQWFPMATVMLGLILAAVIVSWFSLYSNAPGIRRTFVSIITPYAIMGAAIITPLFFLILRSSMTTWLKLVAYIVIVFSGSYAVEWVYFHWIIDAPFIPSDLTKFIFSDIFAISMPFWIGLISLAFLRWRFSDIQVPKITNQETATPSKDRISAFKGNKEFILKLDEIHWVKAEGNYVKLYTADGFYIKHSSLSKTLDSLGERLMRIHRSHLVNLDHIKSISPLDHGDLTITLGSGESLKCSRSFARELRAALGASKD